MSPARTFLVALALLAPAPAVLAGQAVDESRLLRDAAAREARGDFDGAERVLRGLLDVTPSSTGGIFALERVLRAKGTPRALLAVADTFLAHDPTASGVRQLKLRVLMETDSVEAVEEEAERWLRAEPASESAYREVARVFERAFGPDRALEVLARSRVATGNPRALALEAGDVLAAARRVGPAVEEWAAAVGDDGAQAGTVARRIAGLPGDPRSAGQAMVGILARSPAPGRRQAAVRIALELNLAREALQLAPRVAGELDESARVAFLADVARRARDARLGDVAAWAYGELGEGAGTAAERRQFDQRLVELSLAAGDTARALEAQRRVVATLTPGSVDRRKANALEVALQSAQASPRETRVALDAFRREFPEAPELDALAARVAGVLAARGERESAVAVLEGMVGPLSSLERGYLLLEEGASDEARRVLLGALPGLKPESATPVIQLVALLERASPAGRDALARAGAAAHRGGGREAARRLADVTASLPPEERPPLLAEAARIADAAGEDAAAAELRRRILQEHPEAAQTQEAALALARHLAATPGGRHEAVRLLEEWVARWPGSAVAPDARRELERLRRTP